MPPEPLYVTFVCCKKREGRCDGDLWWRTSKVNQLMPAAGASLNRLGSTPCVRQKQPSHQSIDVMAMESDCDHTRERLKHRESHEMRLMQLGQRLLMRWQRQVVRRKHSTFRHTSTLYRPKKPSWRMVLLITSHMPLYFSRAPPTPCACETPTAEKGATVQLHTSPSYDCETALRLRWCRGTKGLFSWWVPPKCTCARCAPACGHRRGPVDTTRAVPHSWTACQCLHEHLIGC